jgi:hypothetical protein
MFCRDIEFACDEKVIKMIGTDKKKEYSTALLNLSSPKHIISACPLAFGENGVKARIKAVLSYKKPAFWVILVAVVLAVASVVAFFAGPASKNDSSSSGISINYGKDSIYDIITFDIDGDGEDELCTLSDGFTSGFTTVGLSVKEKDSPENEYVHLGYYYIYKFCRGKFEFIVQNGNLSIKHSEEKVRINDKLINEKGTYFYDIAWDKGVIHLFENGEELDSIMIYPLENPVITRG